MIHVVMLYSKPEVQQSVVGAILEFIAEGPGAQLFMLIMGINFALSKKTSAKQVLRRSISLLTAAYVLNFFKFLVPLGLNFIPQALLNELQLNDTTEAAIFFFKLGDILHFAAFAQILLYFVHRLHNFHWWSSAIAFTIIIAGHLLWDITTGNSVLDYLLSMVGGHPPNVFFPLFPWLAYPLAGLTLGNYLKSTSVNKVINWSGWVGAALLLISFLFPPTIPKGDYLPFYRTGAPDTIFHLGFVLVWISIIHWLTKKLRNNKLFQFLTFCSKNITLIYLIQWVMICWCLGITGYMQLNMQYSLIWMTLITANTLLLTYAISLTHAQPKNI